jgi:hypothetical protein
LVTDHRQPGDDEIGPSTEHFWCDAAAFDDAVRTAGRERP